MNFALYDYPVGEPILREGSIARVARSPHRITIPLNFSDNLAYLAGYHLGDGYLENFNTTKRRGPFEICYADNSREQISTVIQSIFQQEFGISIRVYPGTTDVWIGKINSKVTHAFLHQIMGLPLGRKLNFSIPVWILTNDLFVRSFLAGFIDAEGSVFVDKRGKPTLCITNKNDDVLKQIINIFGREYAIYFCGVFKKSNRDVFEIKIRSRSALLKFSEIIPLRHPEKVEKLKLICENFQ